MSTSTPASDDSSSYAFLVEWFDTAASLARKYHLTFYPSDNSLSLFDIKAHRTFLKRTPYPSVSLSSLYVGAHVTVYSRTMKVVGYGDEATRGKVEGGSTPAETGRTIALIKPAGVGRIGEFVRGVWEAGLRIGRMRMVGLGTREAREFYGDNELTNRVKDVSSGPCIAVEVVGKQTNNQLPALLAAINDSSSGSAFTATASSQRTAAEELQFLFANPALTSTATFTNCSLLLLRPHCLTSGTAGHILAQLVQSTTLAISALQTFHLDRTTAEEFFEVYKGVVAEYSAWVEEASSGQCVAVEVVRRGKVSGEEEKEGVVGGGVRSVVEELRELAGPYDPEIARHLRPQSWRALYGVNKVKNAVHVTDLKEDGPLESEFFFQLLANSNSQ